MLVDGDPTRDVTITRSIARVWKGGVAVTRTKADAAAPASTERITSGRVGGFDRGELDAAFGTGWTISTDAMMGGRSTARSDVVAGGAAGTSHGLEVSGSVADGAPYPWAGMMFFPGSAPMQPADLSAFSSLRFWARGDGATYHVLVFTEAQGQIPVEATFPTTAAWTEQVITFKALGIDGRGVRGVLFSAGRGQAPFTFRIDEVGFQ